MNKHDVGEKILDTGLWHTQKFGDAPLAHPINWMADPFQNRSWIWLLQQFLFFEDLFVYDDIEGTQDGTHFALKAAKSWWSEFSDFESDPGEMWHDHGSAFRALRLIELQRRLQALGQEDNAPFLDDMIDAHALFLSLDTKYSKSSNHGLDQSLILLTLTLERPNATWAQEYREIARQRLSFEVSSAFANDGGHLENSVHYQEFGIAQLLKIARVEDKYPEEAQAIFPGLDLMIKAALQNLCFMINPLGKCAIIGDTEDNIRSDPFRAGVKRPESYPAWQFVRSLGQTGTAPIQTDMFLKESGWVAMRDAWSGPDDIHIIAKCAYKRQYHRHDDDTTFTLYGMGEEWITDGGLFSYQEKDPLRLFLRSHEAHSISYPEGVIPVRRLGEAETQSGISQSYSSPNYSHVNFQSHMFPGFQSQRNIALNRLQREILIWDLITPHPSDEPKQNHRFVTQFLIPGDKDVEIVSPTKVLVKKDALILEISTTSAPDHVDLALGQETPSLRGWRSVKFGVKEAAHSLRYYNEGSKLNCTYTFRFLTD